MDNFIKEINAKRKTGNWYSYIGIVNGKDIKLKGFKTWLQVFKVNDIDCSGCMEISVKKFNDLLVQAIV